MAASLGVSQHRSTAWHSLRAVGKLVSSGGCVLALFWDGIGQNDPSSKPKTSVKQEFTAPGIRMYVVYCNTRYNAILGIALYLYLKH